MDLEGIQKHDAKYDALTFRNELNALEQLGAVISSIYSKPKIWDASIKSCSGQFRKHAHCFASP